MAYNSTGPTGYGAQFLSFTDKPEDLPRFITRFTAHLASLPKPLHKVLEKDHKDATPENKELVYYQLVKCLTDKTLDVVSAKAKDDGPAALELLNTRYMGNVSDLEVSLLRSLIQMKPTADEDLLGYYTRIDHIRIKLESVNDAYKKVSDKFFTVIALDSLSDSKHNTF